MTFRLRCYLYIRLCRRWACPELDSRLMMPMWSRCPVWIYWSDLPDTWATTLPSCPVLLCHFCRLIIREVNAWSATDCTTVWLRILHQQTLPIRPEKKKIMIDLKTQGSTDDGWTITGLMLGRSTSLKSLLLRGWSETSFKLAPLSPWKLA